MSKGNSKALSGLKVSLQTILGSKEVLEKSIEEEKKILSKRFGKAPSEQDVLWSIINRSAMEKIKTGELGKLSFIYFSEALFLHQIGRPSFKLQQEARGVELKDYLDGEAVEKVKIFVADGECEVCNQKNDKIFTVKEALEKMPIPTKECTHKLNDEAPDGWCLCSYVAEF